MEIKFRWPLYLRCWQESLRRHGVALIVNERVQNAVLGCNLKNNRMISVHFQGKPFDITVIQVYAPITNAKEAEIELFYDNLQDLELIPKIWCPFYHRGLEHKVKWALGSITRNKASGGDGIPVELIQILKDDAVKVLHSICQQIWKTEQWPQDWKSSLFIPISKKGNAKEISNYHTIALISHTSKVMLKIVQVRLQLTVHEPGTFRCLSWI